MVSCWYCGRFGMLDGEHIIPRSRGGPERGKGVTELACKPCNTAKSDRLPSEWCPQIVHAVEREKALIERYGITVGPRRNRSALTKCQRPAPFPT